MKRFLWLAAGFALVLSSAWGQDAAAADLAPYAYREHPGAALPAQAVFRDSDGATVRLTELSNGLPLILVLGYFHCSSLCGIVRASLLKALSAAKLEAGRDYALAVLSIDPNETRAAAREAKAADWAAFTPPGAGDRCHYLTGSAGGIAAIGNSVGFPIRFDQATQQFVHPAGVVFLTERGIVSNYLLGVGFTPAAVRAALERASAGRIAAVGSPLLLICFHFDPSTGRYSLEIMKILRLAGLLTVLILAGLLFLLYRRERVDA